MLSRREFTVLQVVGTAIGLAIAVGGGLLVDRFVSPSSLRWLLGSVAVAVGITLSQVFTGGYASYRKYLAANGGPRLSPPRFWATTGQIIIYGAGMAALAAVTMRAADAPEGATVRTMAGVSWIIIPGALMLYAFVARDWRSELRSRDDAS
jgi:hypothetical protein